MLFQRKRPILVTGAHRSGTTWVGKMLASHPRVGYVHEPLNAHTHPDCPDQHQWHHVTDRDEDRYRAYLEPYLRFRHSWWQDFRSRPDPRRAAGATMRCLQALGLRLWTRPLMKDPIAIFSAEWLARAFDMDVVVMIRHPAAFASSVKRLDWGVPFQCVLDQPRLLQAYLAPFEDDIRRLCAAPVDLVEHAILAWRLVYATVRQYRARHPEWVFVRHEDLSLDPVAGFRGLFARVGLDFPARSRRTVEEYSARENAADAPAGRGDFVRLNSRANIWNWTRRLGPEEIERIRRGTEDVAREFYPEESWWPDPATCRQSA